MTFRIRAWDRDTVRTALEECEELNEEAQKGSCPSQARKRGYDPEHSGKDETVKLIRSLRAKGFGMDVIRSALPGILDHLMASQAA